MDVEPLNIYQINRVYKNILKLNWNAVIINGQIMLYCLKEYGYAYPIHKDVSRNGLFSMLDETKSIEYFDRKSNE